FVLFFIIFVALKGLPPWQFVFLPLVIVYGLTFSFAIGLLIATASVKYRDVKFILPFLIQILFYASPVFLSSEFILNLHIPEALKVIYQCNPFVFILNAFKYCLYGQFESFSITYAFVSLGITLAMLWSSIRYFLNFEKSFADYI
ncbi:MAG: ABC transporter permease, partial [Bacteroidia bacterium]|nr:ABC transporter permease [Bacteroidia bacterium]